MISLQALEAGGIAVLARVAFDRDRAGPARVILHPRPPPARMNRATRRGPTVPTDPSLPSLPSTDRGVPGTAGGGRP